MTPSQRKLARHALGLTQGRKVSYRNAFVVGSGAPAHDEWLEMVENGLAEMMRGNALAGCMDSFWLTRAGAEMALSDGESLDPEDFPS